ncbi:unnamed protein product [Owenia fusiformis]|uniref:Uncharacterized protein n=1 Tax=Owenia fusiformis TaxID=6347 RepID=A0A8J1U8Z5_OWEFU|nr:unnamed protein product [Owenia fusiformis]
MGSAIRGKLVSTLLKKLSRMQEDGIMCDLMIHLQDGSDFHAHRLLFCALSDLVMDTCASLPPDHIVDPKSSWILDFSGTGISMNTMSIIVDYVYGRDTKLNKDDIDTVKQAAELLGMPTVIALCEKQEKMAAQSTFDDNEQIEDDDPEFVEPTAAFDKVEVTPGGRPKRKRKLPSKFSGDNMYIVGEDLQRHFRTKKATEDKSTSDRTTETDNSAKNTHESHPQTKTLNAQRPTVDNVVLINNIQHENTVEVSIKQNDQTYNENVQDNDTSGNMDEDNNANEIPVVVLVEEDLKTLQAEDGDNIFEVGQDDDSDVEKTSIINVSAYSQEVKIPNTGEPVVKGNGNEEERTPVADIEEEGVDKKKEGGSKGESVEEGEATTGTNEGTIQDPDLEELKTGAGKPGSYYTCEVCGSRFKQSRYLKEHIKNTHSNKQAYYCEDCNTFFKRLDQYRQHMALHLGTFKCEKCGKVFSRRRRLEDHIPKCKGVKILSTKRPQLYCDKCEKLFLSFVSLNNHIEREHIQTQPEHQPPDQPQDENQTNDTNEETADEIDKVADLHNNSDSVEPTPAPCAPKNVQKCSICNLIFGSITGLTTHMRSEHFASEGSDPFLTCQMCQVVFPERGSLQRHMRYHVDKDKRTCEDCGQLFSRVDQLNEHRRLHKMNLKCTICEQCFTRPARLRKHLREQHKDVPDYCPCVSSESHTYPSCSIHFPGEQIHECEICGKQIKGSMSNFERHKKSHEQKEYECKTCGKIFDKYGPFYDHEKTHLEKPYECSYEGCNMGFTQKYKLSVHVAAVHNRSRFECDVCNKRFGTAYYLKLHKKCHTEEEWYKCDHPDCDKKYRMKASLKMHRITHGTERPYNCKFCKRGFWQKVNMIQHERVHTNERPFTCNMCDRSFKFKSQLTSHQRFHSGGDEENLRCSTCYKIFSSKSSLTAHERIHTDGRPYQCGMCYKSFQRKDHLVRHVQACQGVTDNQLVLSADVSQNGEIVLSTEGNQQTELILADANHSVGDTSNMVSIIQPESLSDTNNIQVELVNQEDINAEAVAHITENVELADENVQLEETIEIDPDIRGDESGVENEGDGQVLYVDPNSQGVLVKGVDGSENLFYVVLNQSE